MTTRTLPLRIIELDRGDSAELEITEARDKDGTLYDWAAPENAGLLVEFTMRRRADDDEAVVHKSGVVGNAAGGISLTQPGAGVILLRGDSSDGQTGDTIKAGDYDCDVQVRSTDHQVHTLDRFVLRLPWDVTRP